MKILHLTLKVKWFSMIASGEKLEEYREIKKHWISRLAHTFIHHHDESGDWFTFKPIDYDIIRFKNGYAKDAPTMDVEYHGCILTGGIVEWGAEPYETYFVLRLGKILSISNYETKTNRDPQKA